MDARLVRAAEVLYSVMRFVIGLQFATHGAQKLLGIPPGHRVTGPPLAVASGVIELVCGLLIAFGLLTRIAAFVAAGEMAVAYFMVHAPQGFWPLLNKGEAAVIYCSAFLFIAAFGSGRSSLDHALRGGTAIALRTR